MKKNILLVAGGTGGHIWPAISFGSWIETNKKEFNVNYDCGARLIEHEIYKSVNIEPRVLPIEGSPFSGANISQKIHRFLTFFISFFRAQRILRELDPVICILFAGYISVPFMLLCKFNKIPIVIHEQNAYAGKSTRVARIMKIDIFTGWEECNPLKNGTFTPIGVPVRTFKKYDRKDAWKKLGFLERLPKGIIVVGLTGSLGSVSIKDKISKMAKKEKYKKWIFVLPGVSDKPEKIQNNVFLLPHVWDASLLYSLADIAVARGGASTLAELGSLGIPSVVVPWREASDDHQFSNASIFTAENAAVIWDEKRNLTDFENKLAKVYKIYQDPSVKNNIRLYNSANRTCESFWLALSLKIERSAFFGSGQEHKS